MKHFSWKAAIAGGLAVALAGTGCATKKYVAQQLSPIEKRVSPLEERMAKAEAKANEHGTAIDSVETDLSRTKERLTDVDNNGKKNGERISEVGNRVGEVGSQVDKKTAEVKAYADSRSNTLEKYVELRDQFKLTKAQNVLFAIAKSELDEEGKALLDEIAKAAMERKRFVLEVEGFTDSTGQLTKNLELSQKRAETVVRYLTQIHKIPLRSIHLIGSGAHSPVADNNTRDGRKQNRRVEVRLFAPEVENSSALTSAQLR